MNGETGSSVIKWLSDKGFEIDRQGHFLTFHVGTSYALVLCQDTAPDIFNAHKCSYSLKMFEQPEIYMAMPGATQAKGQTDGICQSLDVSTQTRVIISKLNNIDDPSLGRSV